MNLKGEVVAPSSALTGLVVLYPRRTDLTADNSGYQSSLQPLGEIYGLWHQCLSKSRCAPLIKATWTLIQWSMSEDKINNRFLQPSEDRFSRLQKQSRHSWICNANRKFWKCMQTCTIPPPPSCVVRCTRQSQITLKLFVSNNKVIILLHCAYCSRPCCHIFSSFVFLSFTAA